MVAFGLLLGTVIYVSITHHRRCRHDVAFLRRKIARSTPSWPACCLYASAVGLAFGRVHVVDSWRSASIIAPHAHYTTSDRYCCTQAVLFAGRTAERVVDRLRQTPCNETFHKDDALWSLRHGDGRADGRLVQPNVFEHVGLFSGLRGGFVDPHFFIDD